MQKKLLITIGIFSLIVLLFLARLYYPAPLDEANPIAEETPVVTMSWQPYTTKSFHVILPGSPQHIKEKMVLTNSNEAIEYDMYLVQQSVGSTFMISLIRYPDTYDTSDSKQLLEAITNEMLSNNSESQLISSKSGTFLGCPSIDNVIQNPTLHIFMRAFLSNKTLYVVTVVDGQEERAKDNLEKVLNSFQIMKTF